MANKAAKPRSKNFTAAEVAVLVDEVEKRRAVLFGPLKGATLSQHHRDRAWQHVLHAVNAVAPTLRTVVEVKKKFKDLKTRTKQKANAVKREGRRTGGGENDANTPLSSIENKIIQFIGSESIEGIVGGIDTYRNTTINEPSTSTATIEEISGGSGTVNISPPCSPSLSHKPSEENTRNIKSSNPKCPIPPVPKRGKKRTQSEALDEIKKTTSLQEETNQLLRELISEIRSFKDEFLNLKKMEIELMNENIEIKRKKIE